jgi:replication-associated recombination protein RarA
MKSFLGSFSDPVHCTQGPPGTGKSYIGVVITRALLILRRLWMQASPSVGCPPVLVLSYKNHAIDEFLVDLTRSEPCLNPSRLIRIGSSCNDTVLLKYCERSAIHSHPLVIQSHKEVEKIFKFRQFCQLQLASFRSNMLLSQVHFLNPSSIDATEKNNLHAVSKLLGHFIRRKNIIVSSLGLTNENTYDINMEEFALDFEKLKNIESVDSDNPIDYDDIPILYKGIAHYSKNMHVLEILWKWLSGFCPLPKCAYDDVCGNISEEGHMFCERHVCHYSHANDGDCARPVRSDKTKFCLYHACGIEDCHEIRFNEKQTFCYRHGCYKCINEGMDALPAISEYPRNTCEKHPLCIAGECDNLAVGDSDYCEMHTLSSCRATTSKGRPCKKRAISRELGFCRDHIPLAEPVQVQDDTFCAALTKKGNPCTREKIRGSDFCPDHSQARNVKRRHVTPKVQGSESKEVFELLAKENYSKATEVVSAESKVADVEEAQNGSEKNQSQGCDSNVSDDGFETCDELEIAEEKLHIDNVDEIEESEHLQHMRDVYMFEEPEDAYMKPDMDEDIVEESLSPSEEVSREWIPVTLWDWNISIEERWKLIRLLVELEEKMMNVVNKVMAKHSLVAQRQYHDAQVKANSEVYEGKEVIAGTIVGCITRLEAIRATNPFAVVVEEASEVQEPLLFSCLTPTTCKLELIGDHLQLQPNMMQKFEFQKINNMNISMFERLVRADPRFEVPMTVLSIQRRMRKNIADFTRHFYKDITEIQDDESCSTKVIKNRLVHRKFWEGKGREIPGVQPHVYFWTHEGKQVFASVGLSKENPIEAEMVCKLASYLVECGVSPTSIAILTPYKGQMMLLRSKLRAAKLYPEFRDSHKPSVRLSTVDRFQGDEEDIVIASLVLDSNSRTPFVNLVNRMIVLLSRARLGMYIIGNKGYFKDPPEHWKDTFERLQLPGEADSKDTECILYEGSRIGVELPICCPRHRSSRHVATKAYDLRLGFCKVKCNAELDCSHLCLANCHPPEKPHPECSELLQRPCQRHPDQISCSKIMKTGLYRNRTLEAAIASYSCDVKVDAIFPCGHEKKMPCSEAEEYQSGKRKWPTCTEPALEDYEHPGCLHKRKCTCFEYHRFKESPQHAPSCSTKVSYIPPCTHIVNIACNLKQKYESEIVKFVCKKKVQVELPRCKHTTQVSCPIASRLQDWCGESVKDVGEVINDTAYGPKDYDCTEPVMFIRSCGHNQTLQCAEAFDYAIRCPACTVPVTINNPNCGHTSSLPCHQRKLLSEDIRTEPAVLEVDEKSPMLGFMNNPTSEAIKCNEIITQIRKCGHREKVACHQSQSFRDECKVGVLVKSPLCGHEIKVPCHLAKLDQWAPWPEKEKSSSWWKLLHENRILLQNGIPLPSSLPPSLKNLILKCKLQITVRRNGNCEHEFKMDCFSAFTSIFPSLTESGKARSLIPCIEKVKGELNCGHFYEFDCNKYDSYRERPVDGLCKETVVRRCWNFDICRQKLTMACSNESLPCCKTQTTWKCKFNHVIDFKQCAKGTPTACPDCSVDHVKKLCTIAENSSLKLSDMRLTLPVELEKYQYISRSVNISEKVLHTFMDNKATLLTHYLAWIEKRYKFDRPQFNDKWIPCFHHSQNSQDSPDSFNLRYLVNQSTIGTCITLKWWCRRSLTQLLNNMKHENQCISILFGYGYTCRTLIDPNIPSSRSNKNWISDKKKQGFDSVLQSQKGLVSFSSPYCIYATHRITFTKSVLREIIDAFEEEPCLPQEQKISFVLPVSVSDVPSVNDEATDTEANVLAKQILCDIGVDFLRIALKWDGKLFGYPTEISQSIEKELVTKMSFPHPSSENKKANAFSGIQYIEQLEKLPECWGGLRLWKCLEMIEKGYRDDGRDQLEAYVQDLRVSSSYAHPIILIAFARVLEKSDPLNSRECITVFSKLYPDHFTAWLYDNELTRLKGEAEPSLAIGTKDKCQKVAEEWTQLKIEKNCKSNAMDNLMKLTGLAKVKEFALRLFQRGLLLAQLEPEARALNQSSITLNFAFLGNPGTGKTTVAKLIGEILFDSKMRSKKGCVSVTAQKLKDDGPDKFRELVNDKAMGGVLFIDEAYDLDPKGDLKGKPIMSELLTFAEDHRDKLSIIVAGYENDMNEKFFSFNDGLSSRFDNVYFEDFDEGQLKTIWEGLLRERKWEADDKVASVVARRLAKMANRRGFGNARSVRKKFENATQEAFNRDDFEPTHLELRIEDVVGESPLNNPKVQRILDELEEKTGWSNIKKSVREFLNLANKNYENELAGTRLLPICLNRLFLGNPGTGKTTCAKLYGRLLKELKFLSNGEVVSKTGSDFVGSHVGESSTKTNEILRFAQGKVLIIDEAYILDDNLYGKQVIDTLVEKVQGGPDDDIAVLLLGYEKPMLDMLRNQNPGLQRRFPQNYAFMFEDYNDNELLEIFRKSCERQQVKATYKVAQKAICLLAKQRMMPNFGNAGAVDTLIRAAIAKASLRPATQGASVTLLEEDIDTGEEQGDEDPLKVLDNLINIDNVRRELKKLQNSLKVAQREGSDNPYVGHFVYRGSPGTGKTTVARTMASILYRMGLLATNNIVETSALKLTGDFLGQTKTNVANKLGQAKGGVLFIDEAYAFCTSVYGDEAITTVLEAMTDPEYKGMVIIIAGYRNEMDTMLNSNPGLKSRFNRFLDFLDWTEDNCVRFFTDLAAKNNYCVPNDLAAVLSQGFSELKKYRGWGNGRDVNQIWNEALKLSFRSRCRAS